MAEKGAAVYQMVNVANAAAVGEIGAYNYMRKDGPARYLKKGPWKVELEHNIGRLYHYGTKMLEWEYGRRTLPITIKVTGWWSGHGSASDQTGVNATLRALDSKLRYSRKGGAHVNPASYRVSASVGRMLAPITPPEY